MTFDVVQQFVARLFKKLHVKRVRLLTSLVFGAMAGDRAGVAALGRSFALQRGKQIKHAIKQVDRCLSNPGLVIDELLADWTRAVAASGGRLLVALDWTDFGRDRHSLVASRVHEDGRVIPLMWQTVSAAERKGRMALIQRQLLARLRTALGSREAVVIADRGFADVAFYEALRECSFDFIVRFRDCHFVTPLGGIRTNAAKLVPKRGRSRRLARATVGLRTMASVNVVLVRRGRMKAAWCLATSLGARAERIISLYARRFSIEETFRDFKDTRFGWGLGTCAIKRHDRRDRLLLVLAIAGLLLTIVGKLVERAGLSRSLKANTVSRRTHSLLHQGKAAYRAALAKAPSPLAAVVKTLRHPTIETLKFAA